MITSSYKKRGSTAPTVHTQAVLKVLSNSHRFNIMKTLLHTRDDLCVHELSDTVGLSQSATSHQLAYLEARGVVESVRTGKTKCYVPTDSTLTRKVADVVNALS